jgi:integrase
MSIEIKVKLIERKGRGSFVIRWRDPDTGAWKEKVAKTKVKKEAEKAAAQLEADLQQGRYVAASKVSWEEFRLAFESDKLPSLAASTGNSYRSSLNQVKNFLHPEKLSELDAAAINRLQVRMRDAGLRESSIASYLRHIKAALKWAHDLGMLVKMPKIQMPKRARGQRQMKGRPITREEFERMLKAAEVVRPDDSAIWKGLLEGLWLSGLRLGEALELSWDFDAGISVDLTGKFPCFVIAAESEKGFRDRRLPITPDFSMVLNATATENQVGKVFAVAKDFGLDRVGRVISKFGEKANVVVNKEQNKFASAHDLRRAFGTRWSSRVTPAVLQQLMRHASIETTLKFYVEQSADSLGSELWIAFNKGNGESTTIHQRE